MTKQQPRLSCLMVAVGVMAGASQAIGSRNGLGNILSAARAEEKGAAAK